MGIAPRDDAHKPLFLFRHADKLSDRRRVGDGFHLGTKREGQDDLFFYIKMRSKESGQTVLHGL